jgi:hypothetical protein
MPTVVAGPQIGGCGGLRSRSRVVVVGSSVAERSGGATTASPAGGCAGRGGELR